jgi:HPt (histidine-containing phosphotransfer) domain-containing protein
MTESNTLNTEIIDGLKALFKGRLSPFIHNFFDKSEQQLVSLNQAIAQKDLTNIIMIIHSLKGSSGALGAAGMSMLCLELEMKSRNDGYAEEMSSWAQQIQTELNIYKEAITAYLS